MHSLNVVIIPNIVQNVKPGMEDSVGVSERRAREKARMHADILDAALAIANEAGWEGVTIRALAERIEFSPAAIYEHFAAKSDIMTAVALRGLGSLAELLGSNLTPGRQGLECLADTIWTWAFQNRMLFQLLHTGGIFEFGSRATPAQARCLFALVRNAIATATPRSRKNELDDLTDLFWASLSGLILLTMFERIAGGEARAKLLSARLVADLLDSWNLPSARRKDN